VGDRKGEREREREREIKQNTTNHYKGINYREDFFFFFFSSGVESNPREKVSNNIGMTAVSIIMTQREAFPAAAAIHHPPF
jgi:hypothetical protein